MGGQTTRVFAVRRTQALRCGSCFVRSRWRSWRFVVSLVLLHSVPARGRAGQRGRPRPVYVLSVWTNDVDDQADALTQALRSRVRQAPGWSLVETNQSFETLAIALRCPPTPNQLCLDRIGDQLHADHYVWGTMSKEKSGEVTADLRLWTRGMPQVEATESYAENLKRTPSDDALRSVAGRRLLREADEQQHVAGTLRRARWQHGHGHRWWSTARRRQARRRRRAPRPSPSGSHTVAVQVAELHGAVANGHLAGRRRRKS